MYVVTLWEGLQTARSAPLSRCPKMPSLRGQVVPLDCVSNCRICRVAVSTTAHLTPCSRPGSSARLRTSPPQTSNVAPHVDSAPYTQSRFWIRSPEATTFSMCLLLSSGLPSTITYFSHSTSYSNHKGKLQNLKPLLEFFSNRYKSEIEARG